MGDAFQVLFSWMEMAPPRSALGRLRGEREGSPSERACTRHPRCHTQVVSVPPEAACGSSQQFPKQVAHVHGGCPFSQGEGGAWRDGDPTCGETDGWGVESLLFLMGLVYECTHL